MYKMKMKEIGIRELDVRQAILAACFAVDNLDEKGRLHSFRVLDYVSENKAIPKSILFKCFTLALLHDLIEDTDLDIQVIRDNFGEEICEGVQRLTKDKDMPYSEYCKQIKECCGDNTISLCAYFVKLADMKDHLNLKDTLTDRLKNKYLEGLAILL